MKARRNFSPYPTAVVTMVAPKANRFRFLQFRLRTILLLIVLLAIPLAWKCNKVRDQRAAARAVERAGDR